MERSVGLQGSCKHTGVSLVMLCMVHPEEVVAHTHGDIKNVWLIIFCLFFWPKMSVVYEILDLHVLYKMD